MSHAVIKNNINRLLQEKNWRVADIDNKIGHGRPVNNIVRGTSKNPTITILQLIAQALNVEIQDLLLEQSDITKVDFALLSDTYTKVIQEIEPLSQTITFTQNNVTLLVKETYEYSLKLQLEYADINFINWLVKKYYT